MTTYRAPRPFELFARAQGGTGWTYERDTIIGTTRGPTVGPLDDLCDGVCGALEAVERMQADPTRVDALRLGVLWNELLAVLTSLDDYLVALRGVEREHTMAPEFR